MQYLFPIVRNSVLEQGNLYVHVGSTSFISLESARGVLEFL